MDRDNPQGAQLPDDELDGGQDMHLAPAPAGTFDAVPAPLAGILEFLDLFDDARVLRDLELLRASLAAARGHAEALAHLVASAGQERQARERAEAQLLRAVQDFRRTYDRAAQMAEGLDRAYLATIATLARAVEARDGYTAAHVERVRRTSLAIGDVLGIAGDARRQLEFGAVLHDVGKIGIPDAILAKPGPLDPEEWEVMRQHPGIGRRLLDGVEFLAPAVAAVAHHHERWDGKGYPDGLAAEQIPLMGRIVAVADAFDAMTSDRPYRRGLPREVGAAEIERGIGTQFDPDVARAFGAVVSEPR
jgi:HD-GYP domain-containing protein (c-di-GMP phosphodiesterase class II)